MFDIFNTVTCLEQQQQTVLVKSTLLNLKLHCTTWYTQNYQNHADNFLWGDNPQQYRNVYIIIIIIIIIIRV